MDIGYWTFGYRAATLEFTSRNSVQVCSGPDADEMMLGFELSSESTSSSVVIIAGHELDSASNHYYTSIGSIDQ